MAEEINKDYVTIVGGICSAASRDENAYTCMINGDEVVNGRGCEDPRGCRVRMGRQIEFREEEK